MCPTTLCKTLENDTKRMRTNCQVYYYNSIYTYRYFTYVYFMGRKKRRKQNETFLNIVLRWVRSTCYDIVIVHYKTASLWIYNIIIYYCLPIYNETLHLFAFVIFTRYRVGIRYLLVHNNIMGPSRRCILYELGLCCRSLLKDFTE